MGTYINTGNSVFQRARNSSFKNDNVVRHINSELTADIHAAYPDVDVKETDNLMKLLIRNTATNLLKR